MEVLGAVASSIALAEVAGKLLKTLHCYATSVKDAKADIRHLESEIQVLKGLFDQIHVADGSASPLRTTLGECDHELQELALRLKVTAPPKARLWRLGLKSSLKWPFKSQEIEHIVRRLDRHKATINAFLVVDHQ